MTFPFAVDLQGVRYPAPAPKPVSWGGWGRRVVAADWGVLR
jgi:hypothetical protein